MLLKIIVYNNQTVIELNNDDDKELCDKIINYCTTQKTYRIKAIILYNNVLRFHEHKIKYNRGVTYYIKCLDNNTYITIIK